MKTYILRFAIFCAACALIYWAWTSWPSRIPSEILDHPKLSEMGQFGDSFGALNTLFTGLAFAGVAFSVWYQVHEGRSRDKEKRRDDFENRFFHLSAALRTHVQHMDITTERSRPFKGKDCFKGVLQDVCHYLEKEKVEGTIFTSKDIVAAYDLAYNRHQDDLGPYFRMLYHIIRYIEQSPIETKKQYSDLIRAELSSGEVWLVAINGLTENGKKFKPLIKNYRLIKHLPPSDHIDP